MKLVTGFGRNAEVVLEVGEFQLAVLRAISRLGQNAYGANIRKYLSADSDHDVTGAQVYAALMKLRNKGLVESSKIKVDTAQNGTRVRRVYSLNAKGQSTAAGYLMAQNKGGVDETPIPAPAPA